MRTTRTRSYRTRTTRLAPGRVHLTPSRLSQRSRRTAPVLPELELSPARPHSRHIETEPLLRSEPERKDALQLYLREIGQVKLLTPKEEIVLARRIQRGDKRAREQMIKANLRLVVKIARDYDGLGVPLLDLINEGNIGLMKGVGRFDPRKGAKLSTYAAWWIKQSIKRALANQAKTIRLPVHVVDKVAHIRRAELKLREGLDREPTDEEVADELNLDPRRVRRYRQASRALVSLDAPLGDGEVHRIAEIVADPNAGLPSDRLVQATDVGLLEEIMGTLTERERTILALRFGLGDGREQTLEEIGARFGLTRERIRQIQEQALKKIRQRMEERDRPAPEEDEMTAVTA